MKGAARTLWMTAIACLALMAPAVEASARVLEQIDVVSRPSGSEVRVSFSIPVRYVTHAPAAKGDLIQIELRVVSPGDLDPADLSVQETLGWNPTAEVPLTEVIYEGGAPTGPILTLRFTRRVSFRVAGGADFRSITVALPSQPPVDDATDRQPAPPTVSPPGAGGVSASSSVAKQAPRGPQATGGNAAGSEASAGPAVDITHPYVVNLHSSPEPIDPASLPQIPGLDVHRVYTTQFVKDGKVWHRLRLGFFPTRAAAQDYIETSLKQPYSDAWVDKAAIAEREQSAALAILPPGATPRPKPEPQSRKAGAGTVADQPGEASTPSDQRLKQVFEDARVAMTAGEYRRAIQLYTKLLQIPDHEYRQEAQELLGLARERNNQLAHAKAEYEEYLRRYPEGEGADRVRQRLAGLLTARAAPKGKLQAGRDKSEEGSWDTQIYGSFSQFYNRDVSFTDAQGKLVNQSALSSDLDVTTRARNDDSDFRARFTGSFVQDIYTDDPPEQESRVSSLYLDGLDRRVGLSGRVGRQSRSSGGVLGRFDGGLFGVQVIPELRINAVGGFPVDRTTTTTVETEKYFYGLSLDLGTFGEHWDGNLFAINQMVDGIIDRRAVGGEMRYLDINRSAFSLVDYDILYRKLNIFLFTGNWVFTDKTTINLSLDYRKTPILTTSNALQGQQFESISQLLNAFSEDEVRDLARDRTATSRSATIGASRPLTKNLQISGDFTVSKVSDTPASGGVEAVPGTGYEYFYNGQLIGSDLFKQGDIAILGVSFTDATNADTISLTVNTRYPVDDKFRVNPRLRVDLRQNESDGAERIRVSPSLRLNYRVKRYLQLELEGGGEWTNERRPDETERNLGYFVILGYRVDF